MSNCGASPSGEYDSVPSFHTEKRGRLLVLDNPMATAHLLTLLLRKVGLERMTITTNRLNNGLPKLEGDLHDIEQLLEMIN